MERSMYGMAVQESRNNCYYIWRYFNKHIASHLIAAVSYQASNDLTFVMPLPYKYL